MISEEQIEKSLSRFYFYSRISWNLLPQYDREDLKRHAKQVFLNRKSVLYKQGTYPNGVYTLKKGRLKVYQANRDGSVQVLFIYGKDEVFGYRPILSNQYHQSAVAAIEDCELEFIDRNFFLELLQRSIGLSNQLLVSLSYEFAVLSNQINVFAQRGIHERLALTLLILHEKFKSNEQGGGQTGIQLSRIDLANYVGTSAENLSRTLKAFAVEKLIRVEGKSIFIENLKGLFTQSKID